MKRILLTLLSITLLTAFAIGQDEPAKDTIKAGGLVIIKDRMKQRAATEDSVKKHKNLDIEWGLFDIGFSNFKDKTSYGSASANTMAPGLNKESLNLRTGKSINVNIWITMQKLNLINHVVNLKYGLGLELNNYSFEETRIKLRENPTQFYIDPTATNVKKIKLAADYLTVPAMLNFNFAPNSKKGPFGFSAGMSAGYLYSARTKTKTNDDKSKEHGDFNLESFKISYIAEVNLGHFSIYGSYATKSMWESGLDQVPYTVGLRFGKW